MKPSDAIQYVLAGALVSLILLLLLSQLLGQPTIVFVETGSMAPTLEPNDGYIAVPAIFAGEVQEGDVILFESQELGGGELTTHRVVGQTEEGYITQGDANPFTDQDGDEPPVSEGQIKSVAITVGGEVVAIPGLGASIIAVTAVVESAAASVFEPLGIDTPDVSTLSMAILTMGLILFVFSTVRQGTDKRARGGAGRGLLGNAFVVIVIITLVVIIPLNFSMLLPSGTYQYEVLSSTSPTSDEQVIRAGGSGEVTYMMRNSGHLPVMSFLEPASTGVEIPEDRHYVPRRSTANTSITMHAPEETGVHLRFVREYRYLVVLPPSLIASLHAIHPIVALGAINLFVATIVVAISVSTIGTDRLRLRSRNRELPIEDTIRRHVPVLARTDHRPSPTQSSPRGTSRWTREEPGNHPVDREHRLSGGELIELHGRLAEPPTAAGIDADRWTPSVLQTYLATEYGYRYTERECRTVLRRSGVPVTQSNDVSE